MNHEGQRFLFKYDPRAELATRDIVSEGIFSEIKNSKKNFMFLDCRHLNAAAFENHFEGIVAHLKSVGINFQKDLIPIVAAHYQCGGITVDASARTSILNLYAAGECSNTGLHGANRLASNSLLEALVFSHEAHLDVLQKIDKLNLSEENPDCSSLSEKEKIINSDRLQVIYESLKSIMSYDLFSSGNSFQKKKVLIDLILLKLELHEMQSNCSLTPRFFELKNMLEVATLIVNPIIEKAQDKTEELTIVQ